MTKIVTRSSFGPFGIAVAQDVNGSGFTAWARYGETTGANAIAEPAEPVWFEFGASAEGAIENLKAELRQMVH